MKKKNIILNLVTIIFAVFGTLIVCKILNITFMGVKEDKSVEYSIGIYRVKSDSSSLCFNIPEGTRNPVLTFKDVTDRNAVFVADPFLVKKDGNYYMFFEVMNYGQGDIGLATSKDGFSWRYKQIVLDEPFHLSYPFIFKIKGKYFMIPETNEDKSIRLYETIGFPYNWKLVKILLEGKHFSDTTLVFHEGLWWLFTTVDSDLLLYYSERVTGPWVEHPLSPIINGDRNISRSGGNLIVLGNKLIRIAQDCYPSYGNAVRALEITKLTKEEYKEIELKESPLFQASGKGWNKDGMHQLSIVFEASNYGVAVVDGKRYTDKYTFFITLPDFLNKIMRHLVVQK